jgi:hypothetical protein
MKNIILSVLERKELVIKFQCIYKKKSEKKEIIDCYLNLGLNGLFKIINLSPVYCLSS